MNQHIFKLENQEFIELNQLLKLLNLVQSGGEAKFRINASEVKVNGEVENRIRKKLRVGESIVIGQDSIIIE